MERVTTAPRNASTTGLEGYTCGRPGLGATFGPRQGSGSVAALYALNAALAVPIFRGRVMVRLWIRVRGRINPRPHPQPEPEPQPEVIIALL